MRATAGFRIVGLVVIVLGAMGLNMMFVVVGAFLFADALGPVGVHFGPEAAGGALIAALVWSVAFAGLIAVGIGLLGVRAWVIRPARWLALYSMLVGLADFVGAWTNAAGAPFGAAVRELWAAVVLMTFSLGLAALATKCREHALRIAA